MARTAEHIRNRKLARDEEFREKLAAGIRISQLLDIYEELRAIGMGEKKLKSDVANSTLGALKAAADIQFKALAKIIPDLKAVEHSGNVDLNISPEEQYRQDMETLTQAGVIIDQVPDEQRTH